MAKLVIFAHQSLLKELLVFLASTIFILVLCLQQDSHTIPDVYSSWQQNFGNRKAQLPIKGANPLKTLVKGGTLTELELTGLSCSIDEHAEECVINKPIIFDKRSLTIYVQTNDQNPPTNRTVRPYARREDSYCMANLVSPVQILHGKSSSTKPPACQITHNVPAIVFSFGGYTYNNFHAINDVIVPLFITSQNFQSRVQFVITDYNATISKYSHILKQLSSYEIIDSDANDSVHCFPAGVVGLRYHDNLAVNSSEIPGGYTIESFRQFLRETYNLKREVTLKPKRPKILLLSRQKSRKLLNEDEMVHMMHELGFQVHKALPNETTRLDTFAQIVNSCDMIVGAHGAGFTNQIFLPNGAVVVQIVPMALEWQSKQYFGRPANDMGFKYLEYKVEPNETSLYELYGPDHVVNSNPATIWTKGWVAIKPIYVDQQDFKINLTRFRSTLLEALEHFGTSAP